MSVNGLTEGTLADLRTLMAAPPGARRGYTHVAKPAAPAAGTAYTRTVGAAWWERPVAATFLYTASSAAGVRIPVINYLDGDGALLYQVPAAPAVAASGVWQISADLGQTQVQPASVTQEAFGQTTNPTPGTAIATLTLPAGTWLLNWTVSFGGTTAAVEADNYGLYQAGVLLAQSVNSSGSGSVQPQIPYVANIPAGGAAVTVAAIATPTATAVYRVDLAATYQEGLAAYPRLPDMILRSSWQFQITAGGILAGDQISGVVITTERYASNWADGSVAGDEERIIRRLIDLAHGG